MFTPFVIPPYRALILFRNLPSSSPTPESCILSLLSNYGWQLLAWAWACDAFWPIKHKRKPGLLLGKVPSSLRRYTERSSLVPWLLSCPTVIHGIAMASPNHEGITLRTKTVEQRVQRGKTEKPSLYCWPIKISSLEHSCLRNNSITTYTHLSPGCCYLWCKIS